jgi:hypothetical protein
LILAVDIRGVAVGGGSKGKVIGSWTFIQSNCMGNGPNEHFPNCGEWEQESILNNS